MTEMVYRPLGKTGLDVSVLSFGAAPLGNEYGDVDAKVGIRAVHAAIEQGINFFDTSPYYGRTVSEKRLGEALRGKRDNVIVATKGGRYDVAAFDFSPQRLRLSVEESLIHLKTDVIDLYQLHDIEFVLRQGILNDALPMLEQLRQEGKIRFIGITGYPLPLLQDVAEKHPVDTILSYCHYNLMTNSLAEQLLPYCIANDIGMINASSLHMGVLTERGAPPWHPAPAMIHEVGQQIAQLVQQNGGNISRLALQYILQNSQISTTLVGMRTEDEVRQNVGLIGSVLDDELLTAVQKLIEPIKNISWQSGVPENFEPNAVPQRNSDELG